MQTGCAYKGFSTVKTTSGLLSTIENKTPAKMGTLLFNLDYVNKISKGNVAIKLDFLHILIADIEYSIAEINEELDAGNNIQASESIHRLATSFFLLGISSFRKQMKTIEDLARTASDPDLLKNLIIKMEAISKIVIKEIRESAQNMTRR